MTQDALNSVADAPKNNWFDRLAPGWLKPFGRLARWDRPIGWWLLLWPCWWSVALASIASGQAVLNVWHLFLFWVGAVVMRGAGCTFNDIIDRNLDASVARTSSRPIPSGAVSVTNAIGFMVLQALIGLVVLLQFNVFTIWAGIASLAIVAIYPFMKRISDWPQLVLGMAFSWGALMGWAAAFEDIAFPAICLYVGAIFWTIGYDTIYAHQDREDDAMIGVRSTARLFGERTKPALILLYLLALGSIFLACVFADAGPAAFAGLAIGALHMVFQILRLDINDPERCLQLFQSNKIFGAIIFCGLAVEAFIGGL